MTDPTDSYFHIKLSKGNYPNLNWNWTDYDRGNASQRNVILKSHRYLQKKSKSSVLAGFGKEIRKSDFQLLDTDSLRRLQFRNPNNWTKLNVAHPQT